jgi:uncharacterized RDD family membrane protein YckC
MALSLSVIDQETGRNLTATQSLIRYLSYFLSALPLFMVFIWIIFDKKKQGWHDKIAKTVVVRAKNRGIEPVSFSQNTSQFTNNRSI